MNATTTTKLGIVIAVCAVLALLSDCAKDTALSKEQETALASHRTTCLKMGFAVDTPEHMKCVLSLYRQEQVRQAVLREAMAPPSFPPGGSLEAADPNGKWWRHRTLQQ